MKQDKWTVAIEVECQDCDWSAGGGDYRHHDGATAAARRHAERTGHYVTGQHVMVFEYNSRLLP